MVVELIKCLGHSRQINLYRSDLFKLMLHQVVIQISQFAKQLPATYIHLFAEFRLTAAYYQMHSVVQRNDCLFCRLRLEKGVDDLRLWT